MSEEFEVLKTMGICQLCNHNIYEDKSHPSWIACYCKEPKLKPAPVPVPPPVYYDVDC